MVGNAAKSMAQPDHLHFFDGVPTALQPQGAVEMTQKQILSVQNTETAIPIHHIPTFDEVYAMPYVRESLECILDQNIRQYQILYSFKDDLRQEILIHMNHELSNFDPEKSAIQTFARLTIVSGMRIARRKYFRKMMSCKNTLLADMSTAKPHGISESRGPRKVPEAAKRTRGPWPKGGNFGGIL